jgi:tetratricopeptide (TPR) repeat protein
MPLWAQDSTVHYLALKGIDLATNLYYEEAVEVFEQIILLEPENPRGYFLRSAAYFWMFSEDIKNEAIGDKFRDHSFQAAEIAEDRLDENEEDIDAMFYIGGAYGSLGRYYTMTGSYLKAYWYGKKGVLYLEKVVALDPTYYDAYLGLGIYHYLADVLPRFVKILSFLLGVEGDKEKGINELYLTATKGVYTKTEAMFFLGAIYTYREKEYEKAIVIFNELLEKYPGNPGVLFSLGRCYSRMGECDKAVTTFKMILKNEKSQSLLPRGSIYYQLGEVYYNLNNFELAKEYYLQAIAGDTAEVGKKRWITPWSQYKVAHCYEILNDMQKAKYHLKQINEDDSERAYELAQERMDNVMQDIDILLLKARNCEECNNYDQSLILLDSIESKYTNVTDEYIVKNLREVDHQRGIVYYKQKKYQKAIDHLNQIISSNEDEEDRLVYWTYYYLGNAYRALGEFEKAREAYDKAEDTEEDRLLDNIKDEMKALPDN